MHGHVYVPPTSCRGQDAESGSMGITNLELWRTFINLRGLAKYDCDDVSLNRIQYIDTSCS